MVSRSNQLAGCVVASLLGLLLMLRFGTPWPALVTAGAVPSLMCRLSGCTNRRQLSKVAVYAAIGWMLGFMMQSVVAETAVSHARRILTLPLLGCDRHLHASVVSTVMALVGVYFIPGERRTDAMSNHPASGEAASSADTTR